VAFTSGIIKYLLHRFSHAKTTGRQPNMAHWTLYEFDWTDYQHADISLPMQKQCCQA